MKREPISEDDVVRLAQGSGRQISPNFKQQVLDKIRERSKSAPAPSSREKEREREDRERDDGRSR
ncbi:hypothetical protein [Cerasicoccus arenae]|uniref:Uncharacterized protein n=1 Tax=Cerasicoccus arenae TaxID=424488 RepID=A0A8J3DD20_9BACT|nr:hypothetical protein [Cerasicoccus arenae]MBK1857759.1 hypothetical protein [Cerasicoccus arenae]GHC11895.1 hypothetical protein GCM10007047_31540 [Cerasicoccus arenae]